MFSGVHLFLAWENDCLAPIAHTGGCLMVPPSEAEHLWNFTSSESFNSDFNVFILTSNREKWLSNFNSSTSFHWFTESSSHTGLKSISSGAWQHFINTNNVPWVDSTSHVEIIFSGMFWQIFVCSNTGGFQWIWGDLFSI